MDKSTDYIYFLKENDELISALRDNTTMTYDLFHPVICVLNYLVDKNMKVEGQSQDDVDDVFSYGYQYLYESFTTIKSFLEDNFDDDLIDLIDFDKNIYMLLKVDDVDSALNGENKQISAVLDQLYLLIENKEQISEDMVEKIDEAIDEILSREDIQTTIDTYIDIADTLDVDII